MVIGGLAPYSFGPTVGGTVEIGEIETLDKGTLIVGDGVDPAPTTLPVGADTNVLIADSTKVSGLRWGPASALSVNASEAVKGVVEQGTQNEVLSGTVVGGTGAVLFADPGDLLLKREGGTAAPFATFLDLASGTVVGGARGTRSLDLQTTRSAGTQYTYGAYSVAIGSNNTAYGRNTLAAGRGNNASGYYSTAVGYSNTASYNAASVFGYGNVGTQYYTTAIGCNNNSGGAYSSTWGYNNYASAAATVAGGFSNQATAANAVCFGRSNFISAVSGVAMGVMNNVATPGNLNFNTGVISGDPQAVVAGIGINSVAVGIRNQALGLRDIAIGLRCTTGNAYENVAVGMWCTAKGTSTGYTGSVAMGTRCLAQGFGYAYGSVAIGRGCSAYNNYYSFAGDSISIGISCRGRGTTALAFGYRCDTYGTRGIAMGLFSYSTANWGVAFGQRAEAKGNSSLAVGIGAEATGDSSIAIGSGGINQVSSGPEATADNAVCVGRSVFVDGVSGVSFGVGNNINTVSNINDTTGVISGDPQIVNVGGVGINSSSFGVGNQAEGLRSSCVGFKCLATAPDATAVGSGARARIAQTTNIAGPIIVAKDDGEIDADIWKRFSGAVVEILLDEIDLTAAPADKIISAPANCHLWIEEVGIHVTQFAGVLTTQPTIRFGVSGTPQKYLADAVTTLLTAQYKRERYNTLLADDGETSFLFGVATAATGTALTLIGRPYVRMRIVEDE